MLTINHISKYYYGKVALRDVTITIPQGEIIGLFGENGAGKSTLMKSILGFTPVNEGSVTLDGEPIGPDNYERLSFGTCEHSFFEYLTAQEHREFYEMQFTRFNAKRFEALMDFFNLPTYKKIRTLSMGQKNQFETILALSQGADYILLDEPFAGNDIFNRDDFYKVLLGILEPNETILLSTHLIEEVKHFIGRAILLREGQLIGDVDIEQLEEENMDVVDYIKGQYHYKADRVIDALQQSKL